MGKIFYITGPSSSGKDTIFKRILQEEDLHLKNYVMYTTRPIRDGETEGVEYHFTDESNLRRMELENRLIEMRSYQTVHGIWKYFTAVDDNLDLERYDYLMIGVLESFRMTKKFFGADKVIPVYIELDDGIRLQRALDREKAQPNPKYREMCRRYLADAEDFSEEKRREAGIGRGFVNDDLKSCLRDIAVYIKKYQTNS